MTEQHFHLTAQWPGGRNGVGMISKALRGNVEIVLEPELAAAS